MSSQQTYYYRVGAFVFSGIALVTIFVLVLVGGDFFVERRAFETYFDESVQGLSVGSAVNFRGVHIGSVSQIGFVSDSYELTPEQRLTYGQRIRVVASLVPVDADDTRAESVQRIRALADRGLRLRLAASLLTGTAFLEADFVDPQQHPEMDLVWEPKEFYVPSAPSQMATISSAAERIAMRLEALDIQRLFDNIDGLVVGVARAVDDLETEKVAGELQVTLAEFTSTLTRIQRIIDSGRYDFEVTLENLRVASENVRELTETARAFPPVLLRGSQPDKIDVGAQ